MVSYCTLYHRHYDGAYQVGEMMTEQFSLLLTLGLGLFILVGALIPFFAHNSSKFIAFSLAMAFSVMIMLIVFDLLPEAYEAFQTKQIGYLALFVLIGTLSLKILDHFIPDHEDDPTKESDDHDNLRHIGLMSCIALIIHNIIEGMAVYSTGLSSTSSGLMISLGVGLHNIPMGMVIASTLYQKNGNRGKTLLWVLLLSLSTFLGGALLYFIPGFQIEGFSLGVLLSITIGMLLYISFLELLPRICHTKEKMLSLFGFLAGIILLVVALVL